jgi:hypothetical protein
VEIMVALVIGSLLVGVILQFVVGQSRIAAVQTGREEVQQNLRGALEVFAGDLRGSISAGIERADLQAMEFVLPRMWGLVCASTGVQTTALFPNLGVVPPWGEGAGLMVDDGTGWAPAPAARATVTQQPTVASTTATPGCGDLQAQGDVVAFTFVGANHVAGARGSRIAVYERVRYDLATVDGERWLRRSNGMSGPNSFSMQPLAGPVDDTFVAFSYRDPDPIAAPGVNAPTAGIRLVQFRVRTLSRQAAGAEQVRQDSVTVQIRNSTIP